MTKEEMQTWLEVGKLVGSLATPIVIAILGMLLLRRVESIKAPVTKQSDFRKKWADQYFECCQEFMRAFERELALLKGLESYKSSANDKQIEHKKEIVNEISRLHITITELDLRIGRCIVFAPLSGAGAMRAAEDCVNITAGLIASGGGSTDSIIDRMNEFNITSRKVHGEILGLSPHQITKQIS